MSTVGCHLGVDVGGTFTDLVFFDEAGRPHCFKVPSTPARPAQATLAGIDEIVGRLEVAPEALATLHHTHGSTIGVNTLIERRGARLGMITTAGFRDVFELARLAIPHPMRYDSRRPAPIVPRALVREIGGRLDAAGRELQPLDGAEIAAAVDALVAAGAEGIIVCLIHSYRDPRHEYAVARLIGERHPGLPVDCSADIWPQAREYERSVLTAINAYVRPGLQGYIDDLIAGTAQRGIVSEPRVTRSNGGMQRARTLRRKPVAALLSGPAAGVVAAAGESLACGWERADLITLDVGGTSADVGVVRNGEAVLSAEEHVAEFPLLLPTIAVSSVGAGGGSIIWIDEAGTLKVGPRSAGADPGPACYGRGASLPTLTDAMLIAGWLGERQRLGGKIALDRDAALRVLAPLAAALDVDEAEVADDAIALAIAIMAAETSSVAARRGVDAPEFALVAFGGAGPLVGALLAEEVYIKRVLIPGTPGALSALGAAYSHVEGDLIRPVYRELHHLSAGKLAAGAESLTAEAMALLDEEGQALQITARQTSFAADLRYEGQGYDVTVPLPRAWLEAGDIAAIADAFHRAHHAAYGHADTGHGIWFKELRCRVIGTTPRPSAQTIPAGRGAQPVGHRTIRIGGRHHSASIYRRDALGAGDRFAGPAIVEQLDTTTLVPPGWHAEVAASGAIILEGTR